MPSEWRGEARAAPLAVAMSARVQYMPNNPANAVSRSPSGPRHRTA